MDNLIHLLVCLTGVGTFNYTFHGLMGANEQWDCVTVTFVEAP